jgi:hypothetical protein
MCSRARRLVASVHRIRTSVKGHARRRVLAAAAAFVVAAACSVVSVQSQAQTVAFDPISEVAVKIAAILTSADRRTVAVEATEARLHEAIVAQLRARGVAVESAAPAKVHASCGSNLRERGCTAEIVSGDSVQMVSAVRPREVEIGGVVPAIALKLEPLVVQREPILDVATVGDLLLVLEPRRVTLRGRGELSGELPAPIAAALLPVDRRWPRDMRGRLRITDSGFDVFVPGVTCRGRVRPLSLSCAESQGAWPIGLDNAGMVGNRNYFLTPEGVPFYGAAPLGEGRSERWLAADRQNTLMFLDANRSVLRREDAADDVVRVAQSCASGVYVAVAGPNRDGLRGDDLRLLHIGDPALTPIAAWHAAGTLTALWADAGEQGARVVVRSPALDRYDAFRISIACAR